MQDIKKLIADEELEFLNTEQVSKILGCSVTTARKLCNSDDFPSIKVGKNYRILKSEFIKWCHGNVNE